MSLTHSTALKRQFINPGAGDRQLGLVTLSFDSINIVTHIEDILLDDLLLPGDGDGAGAELGVEVLVRLVQTDSLHRGELLDVQNILTKNILLMLML